MSLLGLSTFYTELMRGIGASSRTWQLIDRQPSIPLTGFMVYLCFTYFIEDVYIGNESECHHQNSVIAT